MENLSTDLSKEKSPRTRILETAHRLFYQDGVRATGIDKIIAEASVTKTTFYRQFKSKNKLILEFLEYRHALFIVDFKSNLKANGGTIEAVPLTIEQWFRSDGFRGCAFLNSVGELGTTLPEVKEFTRRHKQEVADMIGEILTASGSHETNETNQHKADAIALAIDGATVRAQFDTTPDGAIALLNLIVGSIIS